MSVHACSFAIAGAGDESRIERQVSAVHREQPNNSSNNSNSNNDDSSSILLTVEDQANAPRVDPKLHINWYESNLLLENDSAEKMTIATIHSVTIFVKVGGVNKRAKFARTVPVFIYGTAGDVENASTAIRNLLALRQECIYVTQRQHKALDIDMRGLAEVA